jgi:hypothetical protein
MKLPFNDIGVSMVVHGEGPYLIDSCISEW